MEFQKAKILLEKMNALLKSMSADEGNVSAIEQDLMRSYIQQFYELFLESNVAVPTSTVRPPRQEEKIELIKPQKRENTAPTPIPTKEDTGIILKKSKPAPPEPTVPMEPERRSAPRVIELSEDLKQMTGTPVQENTPQPKAVLPQEESPKMNSTRLKSSPEALELFEASQARELSEKLGELPIPDLTKAMGLNEKIFTINELFDTDQNAFKRVLQVLNNLKTFDQAKEYLLTEVVDQFDWTNPSKQKKAKHFIKLIRRRYK